jgi:hypothetical protein
MNQRTKLRALLEEERRISARIHALRIANATEERARRGREQGDPLASAKALAAARRALHSLVYSGYPLLHPLLNEVQVGVDEIRRLFRHEIISRLLTDTIDETLANECMRELSAQIDAGQWPNWKEEWDAVEDQVCAKLAAKTGAPHTIHGSLLP